MPPADEFVVIVSAGLPLGEIVVAFGAPVEPDGNDVVGAAVEKRADRGDPMRRWLVIFVESVGRDIADIAVAVGL